MRKTIKNLLLGKNNKLSVLLVLAIFAFVGLGCFINKKSDTDDKKPINEKKSDESSNDKKSSDDKKSDDKKSSDDDKSSVSKSDASKGELPADDEMQEISRQVVKDFNQAVQDEDFADFRLKTAKPFQKEYSAGDMNSSFSGFIQKKDQFGKIFDSITDDNMDATFEEGPKIVKEGGYKVLKMKGIYATFPKTKVDFQFMPDGKEWKLIRLEFKVGIE
jgi:hypothetical protein